MAQLIPHTPLRIPDLLLPNKSIDLEKWSVIACDQFTSSSEYWNEVSSLVGESPSTLHIILPEIFINEPNLEERLENITRASHAYHNNNILDTHNNSLLFINRSITHNNVTTQRKGIILQIDLSMYNPDPHAQVPIKSTEGIITSRLPKRIAMRNASCYDLSHVLMMFEDKDNILLPSLEQEIESLAYSIDLMMDGGHIEAHFLNADTSCNIISQFFSTYMKKNNTDILLAVGDGNHSLMAAKQVWLESGADMNSPNRWALVELVNTHDTHLCIEPIHRILEQTNTTQFFELLEQKGTIHNNPPEKQYAHIIQQGSPSKYWTPHTSGILPIEVLEQEILPTPALFKDIDFLHSEKEVLDLVNKHKTNIGIVFSDFERDRLFSTIREKKLFPRKSFSIGRGQDKKYYIETCLR